MQTDEAEDENNKNLNHVSMRVARDTLMTETRPQALLQSAEFGNELSIVEGKEVELEVQEESK